MATLASLSRCTALAKIYDTCSISNLFEASLPLTHRENRTVIFFEVEFTVYFDLPKRQIYELIDSFTLHHHRHNLIQIFMAIKHHIKIYESDTASSRYKFSRQLKSISKFSMTCSLIAFTPYNLHVHLLTKTKTFNYISAHFSTH